MKGTIITCRHETLELPVLLAWKVVHTGTVPCDSYSVTFLYDRSMAEPLHLAAGFLATEGGAVMLRGIVDEFTVSMGTEGLTATASGRGYAARLLDNESRPLTYQGATLQEIIRNHVTPYGISAAETAAVRANSVYTVAAGSSQWKALEGFCRTYGGFSPRFGRDGRLLAAPEKEEKRLRITGGDPVLSCVLREDHYGVLTEVLVIDKTRNAAYSVQNRDMLDRGGQCRRVVYTPGQSTWAAMRYTGEYQLQQSKKGERTVEVTLPGSFLAFPGDTVELELERMGLRGTFRVAEAENAFSRSGGATVTLTLEERV